MGNGKVLIGFCDAGSVKSEFMVAVMGFTAFDQVRRKIYYGLLHTIGIYLDDNRNILASEFLKRDAEWFLSLDDDIIFEPYHVYHLLDMAAKHDAKIISGLYFGYIKTNFAGSFGPIWLKKTETAFRTLSHEDLAGIPADQDLIEVDSAGMGFCLIHRSVFEQMRDELPDFLPNQWFGRQWRFLKEKPGETVVGNFGEDVNFCWRARQMGLKVYGCPAVSLDHIKSRHENLATFLERMNPAKIVDGKFVEPNPTPNGAVA